MGSSHEISTSVNNNNFSSHIFYRMHVIYQGWNQLIHSKTMQKSSCHLGKNYSIVRTQKTISLYSIRTNCFSSVGIDVIIFQIYYRMRNLVLFSKTIITKRCKY